MGRKGEGRKKRQKSTREERKASKASGVKVRL